MSPAADKNVLRPAPSAPDERIDGLLLCRAGTHRLAFPAAQVVAVESFDPVLEAPHARTAFALEPARGRTLIAETGEAVVVDEVSVMQDSAALLITPAIAQARVGGALRGFVHARDALWPVLNLAGFSRFLVEIGRFA